MGSFFFVYFFARYKLLFSPGTARGCLWSTNAIHAHVSEACRILNESVPAQITSESIKKLEAKLDGKLQSLKETEAIIENDPAYLAHFKNLEQMEKSAEAKQKTVIRATNTIEELEKEREQFDELVLQADEADRDLEEWQEEVKKNRKLRPT